MTYLEEALPDRRPSACRAEALDLLAMADELVTAQPKLGEALHDWRQRVDDLLAGSMVDDLTTEWQLEALAMDFRQSWVALAHSMVAGEMKSPPSDHLPLLPVSLACRFPYERMLDADGLEEKLTGAVPKVSGWQTEIALFSSGLAAITAAVLVLRSLKDKYRRADGNTLRLDMFGGYFETLHLLHLLNSADLSCRRFREEETLLDRFSKGETDVLFLELIAYDWVQTVVDPVRLLEALAARPADRPWLLLLDTTLLGPLFQIGPFLDACGERTPLLVLEIRSGLKLDQVGLEYSNVGIVRILTREDPDTRPVDAGQFKLALLSARKVLGSGLSFLQLALLDAPWVFHPRWMVQHSQSVMDNNRRLALEMSGIHGLFSRLHHPCLSPQRELGWAESPIVVMEFHASEDNEENRDLLRAVIAREVRERRLVFHLGASFGFRHHRCEILVPEAPYTHPDGTDRGFFKVAMGARKGPSLDGTVHLLQELAAYPDFQTLRNAYPEVQLERELAPFPDVRALGMIRQQGSGSD